MNDELKGKVAIVTGAGRMRSIGRRICNTLAQAGASVVVAGTGRPPSSFPEDEQNAGWRDIDSVAEEIVKAGGKTLPLVVDISNEISVGELMRATWKPLGGSTFSSTMPLSVVVRIACRSWISILRFSNASTR